jgi:serine/threonine-protein kinase
MEETRIRRGRSAAPIAELSGGSSSDPPTKFLRGIDPHIELPPGSMVNDEYEIEAKLGEGAMGIVYCARHTKLGRRVAIKVIAPSMGGDPQAIGRFEREARALATLHHPNIVDVYAFGELPDARTYFTMELLSGVTLYERLEHGRVPIDEALDVLGQMAAALEAAHAAGIVHRDLKPENTFLHRMAHEPRAVVKIVDWGLARLAVPDGLERTASGAVIGTSLYLSPEQARGPNVDGRSDIYALGVVAYELLLGQHPFPHAQTSTAAIAAHLVEAPPQPRTIWPEIHADLDALLPAMLAKEPNYRPTLPEVRDVIARVRSGASSQARAMTAPVVHHLRDTRALWMGILIMLALIVGIAIGARGRGSSDFDPPQPRPSTRNEHAPPTSFPSAIAVPVAVVDAGDPVSVTDASIATRLTPLKPRAVLRETDSTITEGVSAAPPIDAPPIDAAPQVTPEPLPPPPLENPEIAKPQIVPAREKVPQHPVTPTRPPGRNDTINPFKKGSSR